MPSVGVQMNGVRSKKTDVDCPTITLPFALTANADEKNESGRLPIGSRPRRADQRHAWPSKPATPPTTYLPLGLALYASPTGNSLVENVLSLPSIQMAASRNPSGASFQPQITRPSPEMPFAREARES